MSTFKSFNFIKFIIRLPNDCLLLFHYFSSKLDVWMVFCVVFVFSTLLEFAILIFIQKQAFDRKIKKMVDSLCREKLLSRSASRYSRGRGSIRSCNIGSIKVMNGIDNIKEGNDEEESSANFDKGNVSWKAGSWENVVENKTIRRNGDQSCTRKLLNSQKRTGKNVTSQNSRMFLVYLCSTPSGLKTLAHQV